MNELRLLLIRHGQTDWNIDGRWQGQLDVPLNEEGKAQAAALAAYLQGRALKAVYASDLSRAYQTAQAVAATSGAPLHPDSRWREMNLGAFQGLTKEEILARHPQAYAAMQSDYFGYVIPQGESRAIMQQRAYAAARDLVTAHPDGGEIAIVSHGGPIKVLLMKLFPDHDAMHDLHIHNTSITTVHHHDGWSVSEIAVTPHLKRDIPTEADGA